MGVRKSRKIVIESEIVENTSYKNGCQVGWKFQKESFFLICLNTFMGKLDQVQGHDGSAFNEESVNTIRDVFGSITGKYQCFEVCCPESSSCASKLLQLRCKVVIR